MGLGVRIKETALSGLAIVETTPFVDSRGAFARLYCESELAGLLAGRRVVQINHSRTVQVGALRGLHFQRSPCAEMKLVRCLRGRVWDVAVDLRAGSSTFLHWHAEELSPHNAHMMVIPEGFAHGFQALEPESELLYLHTAAYAKAAEGGVAWNDPRLGISWPAPVSDISARDLMNPPIDPCFAGLPA